MEETNYDLVEIDVTLFSMTDKGLVVTKGSGTVVTPMSRNLAMLSLATSKTITQTFTKLHESFKDSDYIDGVVVIHSINVETADVRTSVFKISALSSMPTDTTH